jgi:hypothetical protein
METTTKFYEWFISLGGENNHPSEYNVHEKLNNIKLDYSSSLKHRAEEIKEKYNHNFKTK